MATRRSPVLMLARAGRAGLADRVYARVRPVSVAGGAAPGAGARPATGGAGRAAAGAAGQTAAAETAAGAAVSRRGWRGPPRPVGETATGSARAHLRPAATRWIGGEPGCAHATATAPRTQRSNAAPDTRTRGQPRQGQAHPARAAGCRTCTHLQHKERRHKGTTAQEAIPKQEEAESCKGPKISMS